MDKMARDYAEDMHFLFVYVREAHPATHPTWPAHKSLEQKFEQASIMRERHNTPREIVVDALEGDVHKTYGGMPNMSWIVDHAGVVAYKANWTSEIDIRAAIDEVMRHRELKREGGTSLFYRESISVNPSRMRDGRGPGAGQPGAAAAAAESPAPAH
jgi:hypothetical protein